MADRNTALTPGIIHINITGNATGPSVDRVAEVIRWISLTVGIPAIGLAIYTLKNMSKGENKPPIFVVGLLVSDILSFFGRPQASSGTILSSDITSLLFYFSIISNVTLMSCIAHEQHLLLAFPQWRGCWGTVRGSVLVSLAVWAAPFAVLVLALMQFYFWFAVALLSPFPFLLFFAVDSWRALLCSRSNPSTPERRRTVWGLGAIWANYTLLYLPFILSVLLESLSFKEEVRYLELVSHMLLYLSPLVDPFLYIFMTKGPGEVLKALPCCQKTTQTEETRSTVDTVAETIETRL